MIGVSALWIGKAAPFTVHTEMDTAPRHRGTLPAGLAHVTPIRTVAEPTSVQSREIQARAQPAKHRNANTFPLVYRRDVQVRIARMLPMGIQQRKPSAGADLG